MLSREILEWSNEGRRSLVEREASNLLCDLFVPGVRGGSPREQVVKRYLSGCESKGLILVKNGNVQSPPFRQLTGCSCDQFFCTKKIILLG